jgi:hypothetical protein
MRAAEQLDERRDGVELREALLVGGQYGQVAQGTARLLLHSGVSRRQQFYKGGKGSLLQIALEAASNQGAQGTRTCTIIASFSGSTLMLRMTALETT